MRDEVEIAAETILLGERLARQRPTTRQPALKEGYLEPGGVAHGIVHVLRFHPVRVGRAKAALELARKGAASAKVDTSALKAEIEKNPVNFQARFDLALALNVKGDQEGALDQLLEIIRRNRGWNEEAARKQLVEFFDAWGADHPLSVHGRQRLSSLLFA